MSSPSGDAGLAGETKNSDLNTRKLKRLHVAEKPATAHLTAELIERHAHAIEKILEGVTPRQQRNVPANDRPVLPLERFAAARVDAPDQV